MKRDICTIEEAMDVFAEGARLYHRGMFFSSDKMMFGGLKMSNLGIDFIDAHSPTARAVLIPWLNHAEAAVRVTAASALIGSRPDLAFPVLYHIRDWDLTEAADAAFVILAIGEVSGKYISGLCKPDPRHPVPTTNVEDHRYKPR